MHKWFAPCAALLLASSCVDTDRALPYYEKPKSSAHEAPASTVHDLSTATSDMADITDFATECVPGNIELCNGRDDNCNSLIDEGCANMGITALTLAIESFDSDKNPTFTWAGDGTHLLTNGHLICGSLDEPLPDALNGTITMILPDHSAGSEYSCQAQGLLAGESTVIFSAVITVVY